MLKLPFQDGARAILGGALEWKGTLRVPSQPGCPRVCPPWAHRCYATLREGGNYTPSVNRVTEKLKALYDKSY